MDLEVEVATDGPSVAGLAHVPDDLTDVDELALSEGRGMDHVGVEVLAALAEALDDDEVAVEPRVVRALHHSARDRRCQRRIAGTGDVEALMGAAAIARRAELAHGPARPVRPPQGEEVAVELNAAGVLLIPAGHPDRDAISPVGHRATPVVEPVPLLDLLGAWLHGGQLDPAHLVARAGDGDRGVDGRGAAELELDPDPAGRVGEATLR